MKRLLSKCCLLLLTVFILLASKDPSSAIAKDSNSFPEDRIVFPEFFIDVSGEKVPSAELGKKYVGLYFSASWCGPCRKFTPTLIGFRDKFKNEFEVVLISGDGSPKAQANYMKKYSMPWVAMKNKSAEAKHATKLTEVKSIPHLVILDNERNILTIDGKDDLVKMGEKALEHWKSLD